MTRNNLASLNDFLFSQLERLDNEELPHDELKIEIERAKGIVSVSNQVVQVANTLIKVQQIYDDRIDLDAQKPRMLEG